MPRRVAAPSAKENEPVSAIEKDAEDVAEAPKEAKGKKASVKQAGKKGAKTVTIVEDADDLDENDAEDVADAPKAAKGKKAAAKTTGKKGAKAVTGADDAGDNDENEGSSIADDAAMQDEVETDEPVAKTKRGAKKAEEEEEKMPARRGRKAVEKEEKTDVEMGTDEEDTPETVVKGKTARQPAAAKGRRGKKDDDKEEEKEDDAEVAEEKVAPKGRGGRRAAAAVKPAAATEKDDEEVEDEKPAPAPAKGKKVAQAVADEPEKKKAKKDDEKTKPVAKGRSKKAASPEKDEEEEEEEEVVKPAAKGRGKKAAEKDEEEKEEEKQDDDAKPAGRARRAAASKADATMKKAAEDEKKEVVKSAPKRGRGKKAAAEEDEEDATPSKQVKKEDEEENGKSGGKSMTKSIRRTVQVKGKAAVDILCRKASTSHVYVDGELIYDVMLNQTNIGNNNNKYYIIQLLEDDSKNEYSVWFRWGRVGYDGQNKLVECGTNLQKAIKEFSAKFEAKSKNTWPTSFSDFETHPGKYTMIEMDYGNGSNEGETAVKIEEEQEEEEKKCKVESKLDARVQQLMHLICSIRTMTQAVKDLEFDAEKSPLGKITQQQIKEGYACLQRIEEFINKKDFGGDFKQAVNEYYTKIPHACGFRPPALIKTPQQLKSETQLLDLLSDIEYAIKTMKQETKEEDVHPVDRHYASLNCGLNPIEKEEKEFELVSEYLTKTHGATHSFEMQLSNVYRVEREGEEGNQEVMDKIGNRKLLWHGSRLSNFFGILSQGLRIAPPEAPCTGYMFGKGVYFADMATKSGGYCFASEDGQTAFLLLAEVALGEENQLKHADYNANKLPSKKNSTWGVGRTMPDPSQNKEILEKVAVPCGQPIDNPNGNDGSLLYNEFIVYNTQQIRLRYLVEVKFNFN